MTKTITKTKTKKDEKEIFISRADAHDGHLQTAGTKCQRRPLHPKRECR